jgi:DNA polymerase-3 subunit alpha
VGMNAIKHIIAEREANGAFTSLHDFCSRVSPRMVNRRVVESLIQSGAFDELPGHRAQKFHNLDRVLEMAARSSRDVERGQFALFTDDKAFVNDDLMDCEEWSGPEQLRREKESLGLFLSGHPLDKFKDVLRMMSSVSTAKLKSSSNGKHVVIGGLVSGVKTTMDKKQNPMAFVTLEDPDGQAEAVMFSDVLAKHKQNVSTDRVLLLEGKVSCRNGGEGKLLVNNVTPIEEDRPPASGEVHITIDVEQVAEEELDSLKTLLQTRQIGEGDGQSGEQTRVFFHVTEGGKKVCVVRSKTLAVNLDYELLSKLSGTLGAGNIKLVPALMKTLQ